MNATHFVMPTIQKCFYCKSLPQTKMQGAKDGGRNGGRETGRERDKDRDKTDTENPKGPQRDAVRGWMIVP
jgi:hypothetical protein